MPTPAVRGCSLSSKHGLLPSLNCFVSRPCQQKAGPISGTPGTQEGTLRRCPLLCPCPSRQNAHEKEGAAEGKGSCCMGVPGARVPAGSRMLITC